MLTSDYGRLDIDPSIFRKTYENSSTYPAQIPIKEWWDCTYPLRGPGVFNIIGKNLGFKGGNPDSLHVNRRNVDHALDAFQVPSLSVTFKLCVCRDFISTNKKILQRLHSAAVYLLQDGAQTGYNSWFSAGMALPELL